MARNHTVEPGVQEDVTSQPTKQRSYGINHFQVTWNQ